MVAFVVETFLYDTWYIVCIGFISKQN